MDRRDTPIRIPTEAPESDGLVRACAIVRGRVQGVGFRPTVVRHAEACGIAGVVCNAPEGVRIEAEGPRAAVEAFLALVRDAPPPAARIDSFAWEPAAPRGDRGFVIERSDGEGEVATRIPPDLALCAECRRELFDPSDRRFRYPFVNCTNCGPRFTIIRDLPYDRPKTSMARFMMCPACDREYHDPLDRRFDAQPNACPVCGPRLDLVRPEGTTVPGDPVAAAHEMLERGAVVAVLGLGGFHLAADAFSNEAVEALRARKRRPHKAFAVMFRDLATLRRYCDPSPDEVAALTSSEAPIVLLRPGREAARLAASIAPDTREIGALLPATPVHHLLMEPFDALVMTSGNLSEEPIVADLSEFAYLMGRAADAALVHDRAILHRCDDSVMRVDGPRTILFRRARGMVPNPVQLLRETPRVLGCGAELKNTFCLAKGTLAYLSQHIGDLEDWKTLRFFRHEIDAMERLLDIRPETVAYDLHPDYMATRYALERPAVRRIGVQHHHAHIASCMADNGIEGPLIGVAFDGTGYGDDGTIWGGEFLVADYAGYERAACLLPVPLAGGDAAIREPRRSALAWVAAACGEGDPEARRWIAEAFEPDEEETLVSMMRSGWRAPLTSSAGRLFDAVASLLGLCDRATYEGQAALRLEQAAEANRNAGGSRDLLPFEIDASATPWSVDFRPAIRFLIERRGAPEGPGRLAEAFHAVLAEATADVCRALRTARGLGRVALSGGCFQNARLLRECVVRLEQDGFDVYVHRGVPPNDGGIALGQVTVAAARMERA